MEGRERHGPEAKGQATVEFILTLVVALLIIATVVQPSYDNSSNYVLDVSNLAKLRVSWDKLTDAVQYVGLSGVGTKQTIEIVVPQNGYLACENCGNTFTTCNPNSTPNYVVMYYTLVSKAPIPSCVVSSDPAAPQTTCVKMFALPATLSYSCNPSSSPKLTQGIYNVAVQNAGGSVSVTSTKIG